ncbi:MAG: hypothetical protein JNK31_02400 [Candidatus Competibacter sp.]|nr:hypothetical protein [Candidatus Competibacter sp.]
MLKGDRISKFDGKTLDRDFGGSTAKAEFDALLDQKNPDDPVSLEIRRIEPAGTNKLLTVRVVLGAIQ